MAWGSELKIDGLCEDVIPEGGAFRLLGAKLGPTAKSEYGTSQTCLLQVDNVPGQDGPVWLSIIGTAIETQVKQFEPGDFPAMAVIERVQGRQNKYKVLRQAVEGQDELAILKPIPERKQNPTDKALGVTSASGWGNIPEVPH